MTAVVHVDFCSIDHLFAGNPTGNVLAIPNSSGHFFSCHDNRPNGYSTSNTVNDKGLLILWVVWHTYQSFVMYL